MWEGCVLDVQISEYDLLATLPLMIFVLALRGIKGLQALPQYPVRCVMIKNKGPSPSYCGGCDSCAIWGGVVAIDLNHRVKDIALFASRTYTSDDLMYKSSKSALEVGQNRVMTFIYSTQ